MILKLAVPVLLLCVLLPIGYFFRGQQTRKRFNKALAVNVATFFGVLFFSAFFMFSGRVFAAEEVAAVSSGEGLKFLAAALSTGLGCIGTGIGVGQAAAAAIGAISENEAIFGKTLVFVGLAEGIYDRVISMKYNIGNDDLSEFDIYIKEIDEFYQGLYEKNI
ncbi:hypothetical protein AGMMS49975_04200 [Clostridia bacterium]|nr:hypothetical protein AGMMS49975_04200 [Clostridia bacterium]